MPIIHDHELENSEHVSGAGAENGAELARKWDEWERDLKKYGGAGAIERAKSAAHGSQSLDTNSQSAQT